MFKILVVDDSPIMRQWVARSLVMTGFDLNICEAENGRDALQKVGSLRPDLIITDIHMPEVSGEEMLAALAKDEVLRKIPVLILTVDGERFRPQGPTSGPAVVACLRKPASPEELRYQIARLIGRDDGSVGEIE